MPVFEMLTNQDGITTGLLDGGLCLVGAQSAEFALDLKPNTRYAVQMIPIPDGHRLATAEDRKGPLQPDTLYWSGSRNWDRFINETAWVRLNNYVCAVPLAPETIEVQVLGKKKTITLAQAKSFGLVD